MYNYDVGGNAVEQTASEAIADIAQNRTMFVQKLTADDPVKPEAVYNLTSTGQVFEHFKPQVSVDFESAEGTSVNEDLRFNNVGDFGVNNITKQSPFLSDLNVQQDQYQKIMKQLKTNKMMKNVLDNPETKTAFLDALQALIQELDSNK
jgi:predicted component of type VI protein secretion system